MINLLKGALAGAAVVALLLGGAGTFALWNSSVTTDGGTIVTGKLAVAASAIPASWSINGGAQRPTLDGYAIVPGDVVRYTKDMQITAEGDNLVATLALNPGSIKATSASAPADVALADYLRATAVLSATGQGISAGTAPYTVTAGTDGVSENVTVAVTITFPKSSTPGFENATKLGSVTLGALTVTLAQN